MQGYDFKFPTRLWANYHLEILCYSNLVRFLSNLVLPGQRCVDNRSREPNQHRRLYSHPSFLVSRSHLPLRIWAYSAPLFVVSVSHAAGGGDRGDRIHEPAVVMDYTIAGRIFLDLRLRPAGLGPEGICAHVPKTSSLALLCSSQEGLSNLCLRARTRASAS